MDTRTLTGQNAINYARQHGLTLGKYQDPTECAREGLTVEEAEEVAREDPSLIYVATSPTKYVWITDAYTWGADSCTEREMEAACERAEAYLTEHEPEHISITVRPAQSGQIAGIYEIMPNGNWQILGHSVQLPDEVEDLTNRAWEHACETWPTYCVSDGTHTIGYIGGDPAQWPGNMEPPQRESDVVWSREGAEFDATGDLYRVVAGKWADISDRFCECGAVYGEECQADEADDPDDLVAVEWMPGHRRASAEAAGGDLMRTAITLRCDSDCAGRIVKQDPDWARIVETEGPGDEDLYDLFDAAREADRQVWKLEQHEPQNPNLEDTPDYQWVHYAEAVLIRLLDGRWCCSDNMDGLEIVEDESVLRWLAGGTDVRLRPLEG